MAAVPTYSVDFLSLAGSESAARRKPAEDDTAECHVVVAGPKQAGKSTIIQRIMKKTDEKAPKSCVAVDYSFGKRQSSSGAGQLAHFWEVCPEEPLADLVRVVADPSSFRKIVPVVVVDLSRPTDVFSTGMQSLERLKKKLSPYVRKFAAEIAEWTVAEFGVALPTSAVGLPAVIVANKYDMFENKEAEERRIMSRALRFLALHYGCSLVYSSTESTAASRFRQFLNSHIFGSGEAVPTASGARAEESVAKKKVSVTDPGKHLYVWWGTDSISSVGVPKTASAGSEADKWLTVMKECFPPAQDQSDPFAGMLASNFPEFAIDRAIAEVGALRHPSA